MIHQCYISATSVKQKKQTNWKKKYGSDSMQFSVKYDFEDKLDKLISRKGGATLVDIIGFIEAERHQAILETIEKVEKMKKKSLYHWMNFGDMDGSEEFTQGIVENSKDAPMMADGHSAEYVYNQALEDILSALKKEGI